MVAAASARIPTARTLHWTAATVTSPAGEPPAWLGELRALRAEVLYENGRRPEFGKGGARDGDADPLDLHSHHVLARDQSAVVGCVRITPLSAPLPSVTEQTIGQQRLSEVLNHVGASADRVVEHGRWIVAASHQSLGTGIYLMAASFALAFKLGYPFSVATVSEEVVPILVRAGARRVPGLATIPSRKYNDRLIVLYGRQREFAPAALTQFQQMADLLGLGPVYRRAPRR